MRSILTRGGAPRPGRRPARLAGLAACALVLGLAVGCGAPEPAPAAGDAAPLPAPPPATSAPADDSGARIVFLGDSLSAGYGLAEADAFPALIEQALRAEGYAVRVINAGVSGDTSAGGLTRLDWVLRGKPDVVVVELGGNDALRGQPIESTERNLREIVRRAKDGGARVLLLGMDVPTNYGPDYTARFAALYPRVAADLGVPLVPGFVREVGTDPRLLQADGLHPTAEGHRRLALLVQPHLRALLEEGGARRP